MLRRLEKQEPALRVSPRLWAFLGQDDHAPRADRVGLGIESTKHSGYLQADLIQQAGRFGERV